MKTLTEDNKECCYALQDKVWVEDPDGNAWEVFFVKGESAVMNDGSAVKASKETCCTPLGLNADAAAPAKVSGGGCCGPSTKAAPSD